MHHISHKCLIAILVYFLAAPVFLTLLVTCTKDEPRLMKVMNDSIAEVSVASVRLYFTVVDLGEGIDEMGCCWSKATNDPTLVNCGEDSISIGSLTNTGNYQLIIADLNANSHYYIKAYLKNGSRIVYSNTLDFHTEEPTLPVVTTGRSGNITPNSIEIYGAIESIGRTAEGITDYGHCWSKDHPVPTPDDSASHQGPSSDTITFSSVINNLLPNTAYYIRAYAINEAGTGFGSIKTIYTGGDLPTVSTVDVSDITQTGCKCSGDVIAAGSASVTERGVCWGISSSPEITGDHKSSGAGTGSFTVTVSGLSPNTSYHIRAYATNSFGTAYGTDLPFSTGAGSSLPTLTTAEVTDKAATSATCGGYTIDDGGAAITVKGVCWGTASNPSTSLATKTEDGSGPDDFVSYITGLSSGNLYYVRAYAVNESGTGYGQEISFMSTSKPTVVTTTVSGIEPTAAISGGSITGDGGSEITAKGVCWSETSGPTVSLATKTNEGSGSASYASFITGLKPSTKYYVRAYATNINGTSYGTELDFITGFTCGSQFIDPRDGKSYHTVLVGTQCWMAENLAYLPAVSPPGSGSKTEPFYYVYGYSGTSISAAKATQNYSEYGVLYNWTAAMNGAASSSTNPSYVQGACPVGWHLGSDTEWTVLTDYLGGESTAGGALKESDFEHWISPNQGATNSSGFTGLPGGYRNINGNFYNLGEKGFWWTATQYDADYAWTRGLLYDFSYVHLGYGYKDNGVSVRCVRD